MRRAAIVLGLVLSCAGAVVGRSVWEGRRALDTGDVAAAQGDRVGARAAWQRAAQWSVPGAPHVAAARSRLAEHGAHPIAPARPSGPWILAALLGLSLWVGGVVHFARRGLDPAERLVSRDAGAAAALVVVGLLTWMLGLYKA